MIILGIESSCDETAISIIKDSKLLANVVSSQIDVHKKYGGVMPEIASRLHLENIGFVLKKALEDASVKEFLECELTYIPNMEVTLDAEGQEKVHKLVDTLEDLDDVQDVYYNLKED